MCLPWWPESKEQEKLAILFSYRLHTMKGCPYDWKESGFLDKHRIFFKPVDIHYFYKTSSSLLILTIYFLKLIFFWDIMLKLENPRSITYCLG